VFWSCRIRPTGYGAVNGRKWSEIFVVFAGKVFDQWRSGGLLDGVGPVVRWEPVALWAERFREVSDEDPLRAVIKVRGLLAEVRAASKGERRPGERDRSDGAFLVAVRGLTGDGQRPDWGQIARRVGCSGSGLRKRFFRLSGEPLARFHAGQVVARAARNLADGATLGDTAEMCRFVSPFHSSRRFKQFTGLTPSAYRQLCGRRK